MQIVGSYQVHVFIDEHFNKGSQDNKNTYDHLYLPLEEEYILRAQIGIKIYEGSLLLSSAIIGSLGVKTGIHENSVIYDQNRIVICCADSIFCVSIPDLALMWKTKADSATCFEIYQYQNDYIVHGEIEISRLDTNGKIIWQQSGADIFTTIKGTQDFELTEQFIIAKDFENRVYKFDYRGNNLTDKAQFK